MLIAETLTVDGRQLVRNYSDAGYKIRQTDTGLLYDEAVDPVENPLGHSYEETDTPVDDYEEPEEDVYATLGRIMFGEEA